MRLDYKLTRLERLADQREAAAARRRTGDESDPLLVLLKVATFEELLRFRNVLEAIRLREPKDAPPRNLLSDATESELRELTSILTILQQRLAAKRAAGAFRQYQEKKAQGWA